MYPKVYLKKNDFLQRKHPWIFSGALKKTDASLHNQIVYVCDDKDNVLATGYYQNSSIAVKILDFSKQIIDLNFWIKKIAYAYHYRKKIYVDDKYNNAYRLIFAEADELPGLIIDNYNGNLVMQSHTEFMYYQKPIIQQALKDVLKDEMKILFDKSDFCNANENEELPADGIILENGFQFYVNWKEGQKTGFFLDQRDNRNILKQYVSNKVVLNTFAYSGGFSVYALGGGARLVHSVDSSAKAIEWCNKNVQLNNFQQNHQSYIADVFEFLKQMPADFYDVIVLDPPAFAKSIHHKHSAVQAYKRLNLLALEKIKSGGFLLTFSCSGIIDKFLFYNTIAAASFDSKRKIKVIDYLHLPPDHPVIPNFPEGEYLNGMILYVE